MQTPFWVNRALALACIGAALALVDGGSAECRPEKTTLHLKVGARQLPVLVTLDRASIDPHGDRTVKILGVNRGFALVVDSYASRAQGLSRCQSGNERYVRLIDLEKRLERFSKLAESCLKTVDPGDPIAEWDKDGRGFQINLVSETSLHEGVSAGGLVTPLS